MSRSSLELAFQRCPACTEWTPVWPAPLRPSLELTFQRCQVYGDAYNPAEGLRCPLHVYRIVILPATSGKRTVQTGQFSAVRDRAAAEEAISAESRTERHSSSTLCRGRRSPNEVNPIGERGVHSR
jgi:hypothetical protein